MTLAEELKSRNFSKSMNEASFRKRSFADSFTLQVYTDNGQCNVFFPTLDSLLEVKPQVEGDDFCVNGTCCTSSLEFTAGASGTRWLEGLHVHSF